MVNQHSKNREIPIDSIIIRDRTRKDFGDINPLAESISLVGLLQPVVINENNELIEGKRRIKAYEQLGRTEIPVYRVKLEQIILGEFHANTNRKDFTSTERVKITIAVEEYFRKYSRFDVDGIGPTKSKISSLSSAFFWRYSSTMPTMKSVCQTRKQAISHDDLFDAFRLSLQFWR
jgi:ParB-like nuclease domain